LQPQESRALSAYMRFATGCHASHVRAYTHTRGNGHIYQNRYWSTPIFDDLRFVRALRYVEGNALRGGLVGRAEDWRWGSLWERQAPAPRLLTDLPVELPQPWADHVNTGCTEAELQDLRTPIRRGRPKKGTVPIS
jgi:putative transposase